MNVSSSPTLFPSVRNRLLISSSYNSAMDQQRMNLSTPLIQRRSPRLNAATVAREVRNPLTCIDLSIDMLNAAVTDPELKVYMEIIMRSSKRINQQIKELLECREVSTSSYTPY
jgi:signal transduction histidine kinase